MARHDYLDDPNAPKPNSIAVACSVFVTDTSDRILLIRRSDNNLYSIPGGQLEPGETLTQCAVRETLEETGISVEVNGLIGIYSNPDHVIEYDDGEIRQEFSICFSANHVGGFPRVSDESREVVWKHPNELADIEIHPSIRLRIAHGQAQPQPPYYS